MLHLNLSFPRALPLGLPDTLSRAPLRRRAPSRGSLAALARTTQTALAIYETGSSLGTYLKGPIRVVRVIRGSNPSCQSLPVQIAIFSGVIVPCGGSQASM